MIEIRPFAGIGHADHGWLDARHHFSFADYHDPERTHWGRLRVWNDDKIAPHTGFPPHSHRDMEIITYVRTGAISHEDSLGNNGRTEAGDVQVMSAGTGIVHAEYNHEDVETTLFQIWILPERRGLPPSWGTRPFPKADRAGKWAVLASGIAGDEDALPIQAEGRVLGATLTADDTLSYSFAPGHVGYLVAASGSVAIDGKTAQARDGIAISGTNSIEIRAVTDSEIVLVDTRA